MDQLTGMVWPFTIAVLIIAGCIGWVVIESLIVFFKFSYELSYHLTLLYLNKD